MINAEQNKTELEFLKRKIYFPFLLLTLMWVLKLLEFYFSADFKSFGILPRQIEGLSGIITSPFIHGNFKHLINNSLPFFFLISAIRYFYTDNSFIVILFVWIITGFSVWLGGRNAWHIGASGLIYAFFSFLFFSGIWSKDRRLIAISLLVFFLYGGMVWGILPQNENISWESHLYGFFTGFIAAFLFGKSHVKPPDEKENADNDDDFNNFDNSYRDGVNIEYHFNEKQDN